MKKPIAASLLTALLLLAGGFVTPTHGQSPATDLKPTFISPTPGLYVNGWPAFTVSYPKEWVELRGLPGEVYSAGGTRPSLSPGAHAPLLSVGFVVSPLPLEDWTKVFWPFWAQIMTDIEVRSDKSTLLKDGTPAREIEVEALPKYDHTMGKVTDAPKCLSFLLVTKRDHASWIWASVREEKAKLREDLKKITRSLTFLPGREDPVQVPPDVQAFLDMYYTDLVSHDIPNIMAHFSDRFLHSGGNKAFIEQWFRTSPGAFPPRGITREPTVTVFEAQGDKAYVAGFHKAKGDPNDLKAPMTLQQIIKEQGQWKWFGNQK
jgi:hypothetical protein